LPDATLTITTLGEPQFVPGQTALAPDRPYTRFVKTSVTTVSDAKPQNVALNRPTTASSEAPGHSAALADDGNDSTFWSATDDKPGAWWQVDLESPFSINTVETTFLAEGPYQYKIEASPDGKTWTLLADQTHGTSTAKVRQDPCAKNDHCQFVRITFTALPPGQPATLPEVSIQAKPSP